MGISRENLIFFSLSNFLDKLNNVYVKHSSSTIVVGRRKLVMIRTVAGFNFADECWTELQRTCCLVKGCARFVYDKRTAYWEMQRCRNCPAFESEVR